MRVEGDKGDMSYIAVSPCEFAQFRGFQGKK